MPTLILVSESNSFKSIIERKVDQVHYPIIEIEKISDTSSLDSENSIILFDVSSMNISYQELHLMIKEYGKKSIALTPFPTFNEGYHLLRIGIKAYTNLYISIQNFSNALKAVESGGTWYDPGFMQELINKITIEKSSVSNYGNVQMLSEKELQIANYVAKGESTKNIASAFSITERTVKAHIQSCYKKLSLNDRVGLALWVKENI